MVSSPKTWLAGKVLRLLPESVVGKLLPGGFSFSPTDVPSPASPPTTPVRLYVAPANWAGQGWQWANAAQRHLDGVGSFTMYYALGSEFAYEANEVVPAGVYVGSRRWQEAEYRAVSSGFTNVLIEAERQPFGAILDESVEMQVAKLRRAGLRVAMVCHGTDIRLPSRHAAAVADSPFRDAQVRATRRLERSTRRNRALLDRLGLPVFVSTPDLLFDVPYATWLPVVVDVGAWPAGGTVLQRQVPIVVHAPSRASIKGTDLIEPALHRLEGDGVIEYRRIEGVPHASMPGLYAQADIVLDQFRLGDYGVAAVEAMAAGRLVVSHVSTHSRTLVEEVSGRALPIVESTSSELEAILRNILANREYYRSTAADGPGFASAVHGGQLSAHALETFLCEGQPT